MRLLDLSTCVERSVEQSNSSKLLLPSKGDGLAGDRRHPRNLFVKGEFSLSFLKYLLFLESFV
jgi:hypothetical protein